MSYEDVNPLDTSFMCQSAMEFLNHCSGQKPVMCNLREDGTLETETGEIYRMNELFGSATESTESSLECINEDCRCKSRKNENKVLKRE